MDARQIIAGLSDKDKEVLLRLFPSSYAYIDKLADVLDLYYKTKGKLEAEYQAVNAEIRTALEAIKVLIYQSSNATIESHLVHNTLDTKNLTMLQDHVAEWVLGIPGAYISIHLYSEGYSPDSGNELSRFQIQLLRGSYDVTENAADLDELWQKLDQLVLEGFLKKNPPITKTEEYTLGE